MMQQKLPHLQNWVLIMSGVIHCLDVQEAKIILSRAQCLCYCLSLCVKLCPVVTYIVTNFMGPTVDMHWPMDGMYLQHITAQRSTTQQMMRAGVTCGAGSFQTVNAE